MAVLGPFGVIVSLYLSWAVGHYMADSGFTARECLIGYAVTFFATIIPAVFFMFRD
jgi:hypothetical protein